MIYNFAAVKPAFGEHGLKEAVSEEEMDFQNIYFLNTIYMVRSLYSESQNDTENRK